MIWNAAKAASKRSLRKPIKFHEPVGDPALNLKADNDRAQTCCGYLICSCAFVSPLEYGRTRLGAPINYYAHMPRREACWIPGHGIIAGLLTRSQLDKLHNMYAPERADEAHTLW